MTATSEAPTLPGGKVAMARSERRGRHLVATAALRAGDVVLEADPYVAVLLDQHRATRCDHTFAPGANLLRCSRSKAARYASRDAQAAAWREGYRWECAALVGCAPRVPTATVRLAARALWRRRREMEDGCEGGCVDDPAARALGLGAGYDAVDALEHHWDDEPRGRKAVLAQLAVLTRSFMAGRLVSGDDAAAADDDGRGDAVVGEETTTDPAAADPLEVAKLLARFSCNNHTVCDEELNPVGVGCYPVASMMNHSCTPNCAQTFVGKRLVVRCLRDIAPGEELTIAYVELGAPRAERSASLRAHYHFDIDADRADLSVVQSPSTDPTRTVLPGGATLIDHGVHARRPPWPTDAVDDEHLCAVNAPAGRRYASAGLMVVSTRGALGRDDEDEGEEVAEAIDYSGGLGSSGGSVLPGWPGEGGRGRKAWLEIHVWGAMPGADREHTAIRVAEAAHVLSEGEALLTAGDPESALAAFSRGERLIDGDAPGANQKHGDGGAAPAAALSEHHVLRTRLRAAALRAAVDCGDFSSAGRYARALLPAYRLSYPSNHPPLGLHLALLAKVEAHVGRLTAAVTAAREALTALTVSHGPRAGVVAEVARVLEQSEAELAHARGAGAAPPGGGGGRSVKVGGGGGERAGAVGGGSGGRARASIHDKWSDGLWRALADGDDDVEDDAPVVNLGGGGGHVLWGLDSYDRVVVDTDDDDGGSCADDDYDPDALD